MKILLAIDNSKFSQKAIRTIARQFRTKGTQVRVLHVVEPMSSYVSVEMIPHLVPYTARVEEERRKEARGLVRDAATELRRRGFKTSESIDEGDPKARIIDHAANWHADLIILGSHGWKGLSRFLMGSVSEAVTRHARCSVEVVRSQSAVRRVAKKARS